MTFDTSHKPNQQKCATTRSKPNPAFLGYARGRRNLLQILQKRGYAVHAREVHCTLSDHPWVDVGAKKDRALWAFEYKSLNDSLAKGVEQCLAYSRSFDFVVLVTEKRRSTRSRLFTSFRRFGIGLWRFDGTSVTELLKPKHQSPQARLRTHVERQLNWTIEPALEIPLDNWIREPNTLSPRI